MWHQKVHSYVFCSIDKRMADPNFNADNDVRDVYRDILSLNTHMNKEVLNILTEQTLYQMKSY